jgi:hypothetical protein
MRIVRRYMLFCFRTGFVPRVDELVGMLSMSREEFTRAFCAATGRSPAATFRSMQLRWAMDLLANSDRSTADIASAAAYGSTRSPASSPRTSTGSALLSGKQRSTRSPLQFGSSGRASIVRPFLQAGRTPIELLQTACDLYVSQSAEEKNEMLKIVVSNLSVQKDAAGK